MHQLLVPCCQWHVQGKQVKCVLGQAYLERLWEKAARCEWCDIYNHWTRSNHETEGAETSHQWIIKVWTSQVSLTRVGRRSLPENLRWEDVVCLLWWRVPPVCPWWWPSCFCLQSRTLPRDHEEADTFTAFHVANLTAITVSNVVVRASDNVLVILFLCTWQQCCEGHSMASFLRDCGGESTEGTSTWATLLISLNSVNLDLP